jgi:hypothetical protein
VANHYKPRVCPKCKELRKATAFFEMRAGTRVINELCFGCDMERQARSSLRRKPIAGTGRLLPHDAILAAQFNQLRFTHDA